MDEHPSNCGSPDPSNAEVDSNEVDQALRATADPFCADTNEHSDHASGWVSSDASDPDIDDARRISEATVSTDQAPQTPLDDVPFRRQFSAEDVRHRS